MDYRQENMVFSEAKLIQDGGVNIDDRIDMMRDAILDQPGLVHKDAEQEFKFFVSNCMSRTILDQIGGAMNSFSNRSFRLN